jgi:hypothetical protein
MMTMAGKPSTPHWHAEIDCISYLVALHLCCLVFLFLAFLYSILYEKYRQCHNGPRGEYFIWSRIIAVLHWCSIEKEEWWDLCRLCRWSGSFNCARSLLLVAGYKKGLSLWVIILKLILKQETEALQQIECLHSMFLQCANNLTSRNTIILEEKGDTLLSPFIANNHCIAIFLIYYSYFLIYQVMEKIKTRMQLQLSQVDGAWILQYGDFVDCSSFSKISSAFAELKLN